MTRKEAAILYLRLEASAGNSDEQIAMTMVAYADHLSIPIIVDFSGCDMTAWPGNTVEEVLARLWKEIGAERPGKEEKKK